MSEPETIKINDVEYVRKGTEVQTSGEIRIVILQRGWIAVGRLTQNGTNCKLTNASIIRTWGTTKGLGEIAINGPTSKTILDKCPEINFHELTVIATINCVENIWKSKLT